MTWEQVGESSGGNDFLKIEAGKKLRLRVLTDEPYSYKQVFFNDLQRGAILTEETEGLVTDKKAIRMQHAFWVLVESGETKIWQMGNRLANQVKEVYDNYGGFTEVDLVVSRQGTGKDTKYICTPVPVKIDASAVDVTSLTPLEEALAPTSSEDLESLLSGVDPSAEYNPSRMEKQPPVEETETVETPAEETEETPPTAKPKPGAAAPAKGPDPKMAVVKEIMTLIVKHAKYKTPQGKVLLLKKCAPGKTTFGVLSLQELLRVRNELKKA